MTKPPITILLQELKQWRDREARQRGVETYRIFPNAVLEAIAHTLPKNREELCEIKGIKEAKFRQHGQAVLRIVREVVEMAEDGLQTDAVIQDTGNQESPTPLVPDVQYPISDTLTVSQFLDGLNLELSGMAGRIRGEVTSVDVRERVVYFSLKDQEDESLLNCLMFRYQYDVAGVNLSLGDEVIVEGVPDIYKLSGRLSLRVGSIEYAGEGALKKAYDTLYKKLEQAGVFAIENKRPFPQFPERIALITSEVGAALGDFTMNLTRVGFQVKLYPTLVEGKRAVFEIIKAVDFFNQHHNEYDVLVIIRGGGSLESLQAFNTEALVQTVRASKIPILAGIGHERDVSLVALAADQMVSTPTATAQYLSASWDEARQLLRRETLWLETTAEKIVVELQHTVENKELFLREQLSMIFERVEKVERRFQEQFASVPGHLRSVREKLGSFFPYWKSVFEGRLRSTREVLLDVGARLEQYNPNRALKLGYSLVRKEGKLVREAGAVSIGDELRIQLGKGAVQSRVTDIIET